MTTLLAQNAKMNKTNKALGVKVFNFGIPAYKSERRQIITCPMAKDCVKPCYARQGTYTWTPTKNAYENDLFAIGENKKVGLLYHGYNKNKKALGA